MDAVDAEKITRWWADVLGAEVTAIDDRGWRRLKGMPGAPFEAMLFGDVPEPKTVKNRLHWDVYSTVAEMEAAGALVLRRSTRAMPPATPAGSPGQ